MTSPESKDGPISIPSFVQLAALTILLVWCFLILSPFIDLVIWATIIAVAIYPAHKSLSRKTGERSKLSATIIVLTGLATILVPAVLLTESTVQSLEVLGTDLKDGAVSLPPPNSSIAEWPLIGEQVYDTWFVVSEGLEETLNVFGEQLKVVGEWSIRFAGSLARAVLQFAVSIIIAGVLLVSAPAGHRVSLAFASKIAGERGKELTDLSVATIRSVMKGVIGVSIIQAILAAIGMMVIGVPAPGILAGVVLVMAIMQLPTLLLLGPLAVWVYSTAEPIPATLFAVYIVLVSICDSFLKPMLLGRGMDIPMLVILLGAIGGAMLSGIIGLFVGAVVLALGYEIIGRWIVSIEAEIA